MSALTYKKFDDLEAGHLDKMTVFQDCVSAFNASPVQTRKCRLLLAKLVHLLAVGETFPVAEATSLFFGVLKLFQHKDPALRQMVYLAVKELSGRADDVIMVTSSITKDIQSGGDAIFRPDAVRALVRIIDASMVQTYERIFKTEIVDKNASVASAALVSSYHLMPIAKDVVRRWGNEVFEAVSAQKRVQGMTGVSAHYSGSDSRMVSVSVPMSSMYQYHALGLLYHLRAHDRVGLMRMIQQLGGGANGSGGALRNPYALVMLVRYVRRIIDDDPTTRSQLVPYLETLLRHKSETVNIEAAKALLQLRSVSDVEANSAIVVLQAFLTSPRTVTRFAAIRILNRFAMSRPQLVVGCNPDLEVLITDSSRSIATYAITTLLKTGNEVSVDRLMGEIPSFMNDISDEFKIIVVDAVRALALKFPAKHTSMLAFLSSSLRNDGGLPFKSAVTEAMFEMIRAVPASRDAALGHLCEYTEDCEFPELSVRIMHMLGAEGPRAAAPTMYVRYIYNRVVLENVLVRAAAVTALAKFALADDNVRRSVRVLLRRCLDDVSDEVRDRAALSLKLIGLDQPQAEAFLSPQAKYSLPQLEHQLAIYISAGRDALEKPFDISCVALVSEDEARAAARRAKDAVRAKDDLGEPVAKTQPSAANTTSSSASHTPLASGTDLALQRELAEQQYAQTLAAIPEIAAYGRLLKSSAPVSLSDDDSEYVVSAVKHVFAGHLVVQYSVRNTLDGTVLENVVVDAQGDFDQDLVMPIDSLPAGSTGTAYATFVRPEDGALAGRFENALKFVNKESGDDDGFDDTYEVNDLVVSAGDYVVPAYIGNFDHQWDELASVEASRTFQLALPSMAEAVASIVAFLSLAPLDSTDTPTSETSHTLKLFGRTITGERVAAQIRMVYSSKSGVTLKIVARAQTAEFAELVAGSIEDL